MRLDGTKCNFALSPGEHCTSGNESRSKRLSSLPSDLWRNTVDSRAWQDGERESGGLRLLCPRALQSFSHSPSRKKRSNFDICGAHKTENGSARFSTPLFFHASVCRPVGGERRRERRSKGRALMRGRRCLVLTGAVAGEEGICRHEDYFKYFCFYCDFMAKMKLIP